MKATYYGDYSYMTRVQESRYRRVARVRQVRRQKLLIVIGLLITFTLCMIFSIRAFAGTGESRADSDYDRKYRSIMIYCGDTVESLAGEYYDPGFSSVEDLEREIMSINHIKSNEKLIPGNFLIIPYYPEEGGKL